LICVGSPNRFRQLAEQPAAFELAGEASAYIARDARFVGTPPEPIRSAMAAGRCLILLDGLDEIADQATRRRLVEAVEAVYLDPRPGLGSNLCLLTTRPHGFANLALGAGFQTASVRPFGRDDVSAFIRNWYRVAYGESALVDEAAQLARLFRLPPGFGQPIGLEGLGNTADDLVLGCREPFGLAIHPVGEGRQQLQLLLPAETADKAR
jgi:hypothetical protein